MKVKLLRRLRKEAYKTFYLVQNGSKYYMVKNGCLQPGIFTDYNNAVQECNQSRRFYVLYQLYKYKYERGYKRIY